MLLVAVVGFGVGHAAQLRGLARADRLAERRAEAGIAAAAAARLLAAIDTGASESAALQRVAAATLAELEQGARDPFRRVLIVAPQGRVLADARASAAALGRTPPGGDRWERRPEIRFALNGGWVQGRRFSRQLGEEIEVTAGPIARPGRRPLALRVSERAADEGAPIRRALTRTAGIGAGVLAFGLLVAAILARRLARPLQGLEGAAREIADGNLSLRAPVAGAREHRALASAFNRMTGRLIALLRRQQAFAADASHQLRTPLAGQRLRLELLTRKLEGDEGALRDARLALGEADRLDRVVGRLLDRGLTDSERHVRRESVDLAAACREAVERWALVAEDRGIAVRLELAGAASRGGCGRDDLGLILDVLLENALTYAPERSAVTVSLHGTTIAVEDRGPGVAADELERVFERGRRGTASGVSPAGSGLGLAIAREAAERWSARLTLANRSPGPGATARVVVLPTDDPPAP